MIVATVNKFRALLQGRMIAYNRVFDRKNQYTVLVLKDLAKFCRAHTTTFLPDARAHAVLEGRREVWLRIQEHLQLNDEELYEIHRIKETLEEKHER